MADFLTFQVVVDLRFFFLHKILVFCSKNWPRKTTSVKFCDFDFHLFVLTIAIFLIFNLPDSYFAWARDDVSILYKLVRSRRSKFAGGYRTLRCCPPRRLLEVNNNLFRDFAIHNKMQLFQLKVIILLHNYGLKLFSLYNDLNR